MKEPSQLRPAMSGSRGSLSRPPASVNHNAGGGSKPAGKKPGLSLRLFWNAVRNWWHVAAPLGVLCGIAAGLLMYLQFEPTYRATARLQISYDYVLFPHEKWPADQFAAAQQDLMRTSLVLEPVVKEHADDPEIADVEDPLAKLAADLEVRTSGGGQLMEVSYRGTDPARTAAIVNSVIESYMNLRETLDDQRKQEMVNLLKMEQGKWEEVLKGRRESVRNMSIAVEGKDPYAPQEGPEERSSPLRLIEDLDRQIYEAKAMEEMLQTRVESSSAVLQEGEVAPMETTVARAVESDPEIVSIKQQLAEAGERKRQYARLTNSSHFVAANARVEQLEQQLEIARQEVGERISGELHVALGKQHRDQAAGWRGEIAELQKRQEVLQGEREKRLGEIKELHGDTFSLEIARGDLDRAQEIYDRISNRLLALETEKQAPAMVKPLESASAPMLPIERIPWRNTSLAALAGFCLPFLLAVAWEVRVKRVTDVKQLEDESNLAVIGEIAAFPTRTSGRRLSGRLSRRVRLFEESIDSLRTFLILAQPLEKIQVLSVTSAAAGEGKTSVACQLAFSIAKSTGQTTLFIDGDMRDPDAHEVFEVPLEPGLAKVLDGAATLDEAIDRSWGAQIHVLPAGVLHVNPHRLMGNGAFAALISEVRDRYAFVVIDTPPVLPASESLVLAAAADATLLCVMRDRSRTDQLARTYSRLVQAGANVVGSVLSGVPSRQYSRAYGEYDYVR